MTRELDLCDTIKTTIALYSEFHNIYRIELPKFQRTTDDDRVTEIFNDIRMKTDNFQKQYNPPGIITIFETDKGYLIGDGQHRLAVFKHIYDTCNMDVRFFCQCIKVSSYGEAKSYFNLINKTVPIPNIPDCIELISISAITHTMKQAFKNFFSDAPSGKCNRPHIHILRLTEELGLLSEQLIQHGIHLTSQDFMYRLDLINTKYKDQNLSLFKKNNSDDINKIYQTCIKKGGLYVGLYPDYRWMWEMYDLIKPSEIVTLISTDTKIDVAIRNYIYEQDKRQCKICKRHLECMDFEAGHIISRVNNGTNDANNLVVICSTCNKSIGKRNIPDYCVNKGIPWVPII